MNVKPVILVTIFAFAFYALTSLAPAYVSSVKHAQSLHAQRLAAIEKF